MCGSAILRRLWQLRQNKMDHKSNTELQQWWVYMLRCADDSLYTGVTTDLVRRLDEHNGKHAGRGARYTRARRPVKLVWQEAGHDRGSALKREYELKQLSRREKLLLCINS